MLLYQVNIVLQDWKTNAGELFIDTLSISAFRLPSKDSD